MQTGRYIDRDHRLLAGIEHIDRGEPVAGRLAFQSGAEHGIDNQLDMCRDIRMKGLDLATRGDVGLARRQGIALHPGRITKLHDEYRMAGLQRQPANDVAIAAIVARTAEHQQGARLRPAVAQQVPGRLAGARHQRITRNARLLDGAAVELPHLCGGVEWICA